MPQGRNLHVLSLSLFAALIIYPLSTGPVAWLVDRGVLPSRLYEPFFMPLIVLYEHSNHASRFFDWYVCRVWNVQPSMDHPVPTAFNMR